MIKVSNLVKHFGSNYAVNDISFEAGNGEVIGILGPNGAGKSTMMNIITGYLSYSSGSVEINGHEILEDTAAAKRGVGYLPELPPLYPEMTVNDYLGFVYELKSCTLNRKKHLTEICEVTGIADVRERIIGNLSKGYRQRVGIAQALIGNPGTIILDEPTVGLDPREIMEIRNLIRTLGIDHTVLLSTHILSEVQSVCDRILIINKGRLVANERTSEIANAVEGNRRISAKICGPQKEVLSMLRAKRGVVRADAVGQTDLDSTTYVIESEPGIDIRKSLFASLAERGYSLIGLESMSVGLEDVFLALLERPEPNSKKRRVNRRGASAQPNGTPDGDNAGK